MKLLNYPHCPDPEAAFTYSSGFNIRAQVLGPCEAYVSLLVPDPIHPFSRISLTGSEIIIECIGEMPSLTSGIQQLADQAADMLGLEVGKATFTRSRYAKINPVEDELRKGFMHWATDQYNIFSLGRFATWRPGLLLDDLVQDVRKIAQWSEDRYEVRKGR
jgi:hypothetical protein